MKKVIISITSLIALTMILFIIFFDTLSKSVAESVASKKFKTQVIIKEIDTDFFNRSATITDIVIANPKGFKKPTAFSLDKIFLKIGEDIGENNDLLIIKKLNFEGVFLNFSQQKLRINLYELYDNLGLKAKKIKREKQQITTEKNTSKTKKAPLKVIIESIIFSNITVNLNSKYFKKNIKLPNISISDFGKKEQGIPATEVPQKLMKFVLDNMKKELKKQGAVFGKKELQKSFMKKANEKVKKLEKKVKNFFKGLSF